MAEIADQLPGELIESSWGNDIRDRTVQRYTTTAERDSLNPSPSEGDLAWILGQNELQIYSSTSPAGWRRFIPESDTKDDYISSTAYAYSSTGDWADPTTAPPPNDQTLSIGPRVTGVNIYGGRVLIAIGAQGETDNPNLDGYMGVEVSGSGGVGVQVAPDFGKAAVFSDVASKGYSKTFVLGGLPAGGIEGVTITAKYRTSGSTGNFLIQRRQLVVMPL